MICSCYNLLQDSDDEELFISKEDLHEKPKHQSTKKVKPLRPQCSPAQTATKLKDKSVCPEEQLVDVTFVETVKPEQSIDKPKLVQPETAQPVSQPSPVAIKPTRPVGKPVRPDVKPTRPEGKPVRPERKSIQQQQQDVVQPETDILLEEKPHLPKRPPSVVKAVPTRPQAPVKRRPAPPRPAPAKVETSKAAIVTENPQQVHLKTSSL